MEFDDPVVSGNILVRDAIRSPNYVSGVSGWTINVDGSVEVNNATVRGRVVIGPDGDAQLILEEFNGAGIMSLVPGGPTSPVTNGELRVQENTFGPGIPPNILEVSLASPYDDVGPAKLYLRKYVGDITSIVLAASWIDLQTDVVDVSGAIDVRRVGTDTCFTVRTSTDTEPRLTVLSNGTMRFGSGSATPDTRMYRSAVGELAADPIKANIGLAVETWHNISFVGAAGWASAAAPQVAGRYRKVASPPNSVQIVGELTVGTDADATVIATMPVGYRPISVVPIPVAANPLPAGSLSPLLQIDTSGNVRCYGLTGATTTVYVNHVYPLDA